MKLSVQTNFPDVNLQLIQLRNDIARKAMASALNRTLEQARTLMRREITKEFNVRASFVRERLKINRAYARGRLEIRAELVGGGKRRSANIIAFVERSVSLAQGRKRAKDGTLRVLRVKVKRGAYKPLQGAFIGNKGRTVFKRTGKSRLPIEPVRTIEVAQMFNTKRINQAVVKAIEQRFPAIFKREAEYYVAKLGGKP